MLPAAQQIVKEAGIAIEVHRLRLVGEVGVVDTRHRLLLEGTVGTVGRAAAQGARQAVGQQRRLWCRQAEVQGHSR